MNTTYMSEVACSLFTENN